MEKKDKPVNTPDKQKPNRNHARPDQRPGSQTKNNSQRNDNPEKAVEITDDPEGTKQKIPNMEF